MYVCGTAVCSWVCWVDIRAEQSLRKGVYRDIERQEQKKKFQQEQEQEQNKQAGGVANDTGST